MLPIYIYTESHNKTLELTRALKSRDDNWVMAFVTVEHCASVNESLLLLLLILSIALKGVTPTYSTFAQMKAMMKINTSAYAIRTKFSSTGWCKSRGTVLFLSSVKSEMTDTIEIGLKILPQRFCNQKYVVL